MPDRCGWFVPAFAIGLTLLALTGCQHRSLLSDPEIIKQTAAAAGDHETLVLQAGNWEKPTPPEPGTPQGDLHIAQALFRLEDYGKAAKAFEEVAEKHKKTPEVHEQALYGKAESEYRAGKHVQARDSLEELLKTYPGSPHLSDANRLIFEISDRWLEDAREDLRLGRPSTIHRFVKFEKDRKPFFDEDGHAVKGFEFVHDKEPNGPLADDALMKIANYHKAMGDYKEAEQAYDQIIHDYPRSEFQAQAHLLSAETKLQAHKGSAYDSRKLEEARRTLRAALSLYPNELEPERQRIYRELDEIRQQQAKSQFEIAEWYRKHHPSSARIYYEYLLKNKDFAGTKWAERAKERLQELEQSSATSSESNEPERGPLSRLLAH